MKERTRYFDNPIMRKIILGSIVLFVVIINLLAFYQFSIVAPGGNDSIPRWIGTRAWLYEGINPYSAEVTARAQKMIYGRLATPEEDQQKFVYPFYTILFYLPVVWMKYEWARAIYMLILEWAILALVIVSIKIMRWSPPKWLLISTILFGILFYHSIRTIVLWQLAGICALLITLSLWGILNKNDFVAGISLALASIKPQMVYLIIPLVFFSGIAFRRWKLSLSLLITLLLLIGGSFLLLPTWMSDMIQQMVDYEHYTYTVSPIHILTHIIFPWLGNNTEKLLIMILLVWLMYEWLQLINFEEDYFIWVFLLTLVITNLIVIRTATTNYLMMFPVIIYIFQKLSSSNAPKVNFWILLLEIIYFSGTWFLFFMTVQGREEQWQMYLPLPFFVLIGLIIFRFRGNITSKNHSQRYW